MLVNDDRSFLNIDSNTDPCMSMILSAISGGKVSIRVSTGIYEIGHFGSSNWPGKKYYNSWDYHNEPPPLSIDSYGVCDSYQQILDQCPELQSSLDRKFAITITPIIKAEEPEYGGWRWHKWGPYIGTQDPQCEYIHDEPNIEKVYVYHIYEQKP